MLSKQWNEMILFACEMPLGANILIESGSGKEKLMLTSVSMTVGGVRGWNPLGVGVAEDLPWTLTLRSRVTEGQGWSEGEASPLGYNFLSLCA